MRLKQTSETKGGGGFWNEHWKTQKLRRVEGVLDLHKSGNDLSLDLHKSSNELSHQSGILHFLIFHLLGQRPPYFGHENMVNTYQFYVLIFI